MTRPTATLPELQAWSKTAAPLAAAVEHARTFAASERARVNAYIRPIFDTFTFTVADKYAQDAPGERITKPDHLYLSEDETTVRAYFDACDAAHRAHGFTGPKDHCPVLIAEHAVITAEHALIDSAAPLFGVTDIYGDDRTMYLDLLIGACQLARREYAAAARLLGGRA